MSGQVTETTVLNGYDDACQQLPICMSPSISLAYVFCYMP